MVGEDSQLRISSHTTVPVSRRRVLVVDDDHDLATVVARTLREYDVTLAYSGEEALEILRGGAHFDLVVSDMMMPRMTGADLHEILQREFPRIAQSMLFLSAGTMSVATERFLAAMGDRFMPKPFGVAAFRRRVAAAF